MQLQFHETSPGVFTSQCVDQFDACYVITRLISVEGVTTYAVDLVSRDDTYALDLHDTYADAITDAESHLEWQMWQESVESPENGSQSLQNENGPA